MKPKTSFILIRIDNQEEEENEEGRTRKQLRAQREREREREREDSLIILSLPLFVCNVTCLTHGNFNCIPYILYYEILFRFSSCLLFLKLQKLLNTFFSLSKNC
jgi:hypothetical protein